MTDAELKHIIYQKPFKPFIVRLASGDTFEVKRSLRTSIYDPIAIFGINEDAETGVARKTRIVPLKDIVAVEVLQSA